MSLSYFVEVHYRWLICLSWFSCSYREPKLDTRKPRDVVIIRCSLRRLMPFSQLSTRQLTSSEDDRYILLSTAASLTAWARRLPPARPTSRSPGLLILLSECQPLPGNARHSRQLKSRDSYVISTMNCTNSAERSRAGTQALLDSQLSTLSFKQYVISAMQNLDV